jgi:hypothetical protein
MKLTKIFRAISPVLTVSAIFFSVYAHASDKQEVIYMFHVKSSGGSGPDGGLYIDPSGN